MDAVAKRRLKRSEDVRREKVLGKATRPGWRRRRGVGGGCGAVSVDMPKSVALICDEWVHGHTNATRECTHTSRPSRAPSPSQKRSSVL